MLTQHNPIFSNKIIPWSKSRVYSKVINNDYNFNVDSQLMNYHNLVSTSDQYNFSVQIFLDRNIHSDSVYYIAKTLINIDKSFYYLEKNKNTDCFINLYYDQVEIMKNNMINSLNKKDWHKYQVDSIFNRTKIALDKRLEKYLNDVNHGKNENAIKRYIEKVNESIGIDNSILIEDEKFKRYINRAIQDDQNYNIKLYNYGSSLMKLNKYEEAINLFKQAIKHGDNHPWLYYNTGLAYYNLEDNENACLYFKKSSNLGEIVEPEYLEACID
jgi:tetratricopeptide (TPR) repeat protein